MFDCTMQSANPALTVCRRVRLLSMEVDELSKEQAAGLKVRLLELVGEPEAPFCVECQRGFRGWLGGARAVDLLVPASTQR